MVSIHHQRLWCGAFVGACALWTSLGVARADGKTAPRRPNIVMILMDDWGWADLGCYGSKFHRTPNVDRMAADGMRFTQAYAVCPVCSPTRAAIMTGKYPARLHLTDYIPGQRDSPQRKLLRADFRQELPLEEITIAELLHEAGYATAAIGKWHLGGAGFEPSRQGFDLGIAGDEKGSVLSYFAPFRNREAQSLPGLDRAGEGEYLTDRLSAEAVRFIEEHQKQPFFLYLPHFAVHTPLMAKPELVAKYEAALKPPGLQRNPDYAAMIESVDDGVGRILRKLESLGLAENTLVIFTSDNGGLATAEGPKTPATNNAPLREGKGYLYEGGIRVPVVARWPAAIKPDSTCDAPTSSIDWLPTIAEVCGLDVSHAIDGVSLVPLLKQTGALESRPLYWHYPHYSPQGGKPGGAVREGDFKLIEFYEQGRRELFNVVKDTSENTNLIDQEPERAERLALKLSSWLKEVDAQPARPNPDYRPDGQADDGTITLPAANAEIHGVMVRYEPLPHKRTLGFWVRRDDWVSFELAVDKPGNFQIEILQGCGNGSGGSQVDFNIADQTVTTTVEETGGFQKFVARQIGEIKISQPGRYTLSVKPRTKPGPAVMDLREVRLIPVALK